MIYYLVFEESKNALDTGELICPICMDYLVHPSTAVCGHTFCERCFFEWMMFSRVIHIHLFIYHISAPPNISHIIIYQGYNIYIYIYSHVQCAAAVCELNSRLMLS